MSDLRETTKNIQRATGEDDDGVFGMRTALAVMRALNVAAGIEEDATAKTPSAPSEEWKRGLDSRTISHIATLDEKCRERFAEFALLAKATAATLGCDYVMISGDRSYAEQDALYAEGRTKPGKIVTKARGGYSDHNFGIAGDFGVFRGKAYLDNTDPAFAAKVHKACSVHAEACGLEWGGTWKGFKDLPHYGVKTGLTMAERRKRMSAKGSVL